MRTQRASLVPLFMAANKAVRVRGLVDDTLAECGVAVMDDDNPRVVYTGLGHEVGRLPSSLRLLLDMNISFTSVQT